MARSCGYLAFVSILLVGSTLGGEEPLAVQADQGHKLTTLCVQVREPPGQICGPVVDDKARSTGPQMLSLPPGDSSRMMDQMMRSLSPQMRNMPQLRSLPPPPGAVITDYIQGVPVFSMRSAAQRLAAKAAPPPAADFRAAEPCPDHPPAARIVGPPSPMFAGGPGPYPGFAPQMRTPFPFAPFGAEPPQQQLRQSEQQYILQQQQKAGGPPGGPADCPEDFQQDMMRNAPLPMRTFPPRVYPNGGYLRESVNPAEALAKQCEEQEKQLQQKTLEIDGLKKEIDRLSSASSTTAEKSTVVEKKTVTTKSTQDKSEASASESKQQKKESNGNGPVKRKR